jgi:hypothetical protein
MEENDFVAVVLQIVFNGIDGGKGERNSLPELAGFFFPAATN